MLENTFIPNSPAESSSSSSSSVESQTRPKTSTEKLIERYETLKKYPNINPPNRYPKTYKPPTDRNRFTVEYHDLIFANAVSLIPNIDIGYQHNLTPEKLEEWLSNAKTYFESLTKYLNEKCDEQYKHYLEIEKQKASSTKLNMENIESLPDDLIHKIHSYLLPETRIILLTSKYPDYMKSILKQNNAKLKKILHNIIDKRYHKEIYKSAEHRSCFPTNLDLRFTFKNKDSFNIITNRLLETFMTVPAKTPELYQYFQKVALRLVQFLVYNGAYQERPPPVKPAKQAKNPAKKITKKSTKKT
jgi:hypothetical protein